MTPEQALQILMNTAAQAHLPAQAHANAQNAGKIILEFINSIRAPKKVDKKTDKKEEPKVPVMSISKPVVAEKKEDSKAVKA